MRSRTILALAFVLLATILAPRLAFAAMNVPTNFLALNTGLMGWWTMDGNNLINNVADSSGNGNNGYMNGFTSTSSAQVPGKIGQALKFNGSSSYVNTGKALSNFTGGVNGTLAAWAYPTASGTGACLNYSVSAMITDGDGIGGGGYVELGLDSLNNWCGGWSTDGTSNDYMSSPASLNKWSYVVVSVNNGTEFLYVNGVQVATRGTGTLTVMSYPIKIGQGYTGNYFNGLIDDARIYNRALSAAEIAQLYNATAGVRMNVSKVGPNALNSGLMGWWTLDGQDMIQNVADKSGNGNNGFLLGKAATATSSVVVRGKIGQALYFDGRTAATTTQVATSLGNSVKGLSNATISAWVYPLANNPNEEDIYFEPINGSAGLTRFALSADASGYVELVGRVPDGSGIITWVLSPTPLPLNQWTHVVGVYNGSANTASLYFNGALKQSANPGLSAFTGSNPGTVPVIGGELDSNGNDFIGSIDDVRIYNRALSAAEITQLYSATAGGRAETSKIGSGQLNSGLVGWWTLDGDQTSWTTGVTKDSSGSGNNGALLNFSTSTSPTFGKIGQALAFNGSELYVPGPTIGTSNTVLMWVYPTSFPGSYNNLVGQDSSTAFQIAAGSKLLSYGGGPYLSTSNTALKANQWQHVGMVNNGGTVTYYLNGQPDGTPGGNNAPGYTVHMIGDDNTNEVYAGKIDDIRVYNRSLSAAEVAQIYNLGR